MRAGDGHDVAGVFLFGHGQGSLTDETKCGAGFAQGGVDRDAFVENETVALKMLAAALLEISQNAAIELEDPGEANVLKKRRGFFATDAAGAKSHDWLIFELIGQRRGGGGKFAKMIQIECAGAAEGAQLCLVSVASVEKRDGLALIEPFLELSWCDSWRGPAAGINSVDPEGDDLLLDLHEHSIERLMMALADFRREIGQAGNGSEIIEKAIQGRSFGGNENINSFLAEQDGAAHAGVEAHFAQGSLEQREIA